MRFNQQNLLAGDSSLADQGFELDFVNFDAVLLRQKIYGYEPHIVPSVLVLSSRVSQSYYYVHGVSPIELCPDAQGDILFIKKYTD